MNWRKIYEKEYTFLHGLQSERKVSYFLTKAENVYGAAVVEERENAENLCAEQMPFTSDEQKAKDILLFLYENGIGTTQLTDVLTDINLNDSARICDLKGGNSSAY